MSRAKHSLSRLLSYSACLMADDQTVRKAVPHTSLSGPLGCTARAHRGRLARSRRSRATDVLPECNRDVMSRLCLTARPTTAIGGLRVTPRVRGSPEWRPDHNCMYYPAFFTSTGYPIRRQSTSGGRSPPAIPFSSHGGPSEGIGVPV
jgi:hypothetical protein